MRPLCVLCVLCVSILSLSGCGVAVAQQPPAKPPALNPQLSSPNAPTPHPFALTERFEAAVSAQSGELVQIREQAEATNAKLDEVLEQLKFNAGQQCDLLDLWKSGPSDSPEPPALSQPLSGEPPLIFDPLPDTVPVTPAPVVDGQPVDLGKFIEQWYRRPWNGDAVTCLTSRFGVSAEMLARLPGDVVERLHAAIHEHAQSQRAAPAKAPAALPPAVAGPVARSPCPGGVCPAPSAQVWQQPMRRGLLGRRR